MDHLQKYHCRILSAYTVVVTLVVKGSGKARNGQPLDRWDPPAIAVDAVEVVKLTAAVDVVAVAVAEVTGNSAAVEDPLGGGDREGWPPLHNGDVADCCNGDATDGDDGQVVCSACSVGGCSFSANSMA
jgi:hypothetical protein